MNWSLISDDKVMPFITGNEEIYDTWKQTPGGFLWLDIEGPTSEEVGQLLAEKFTFDSNDIKDALLDRHPPRFSSNDKQFFLLLKIAA